MNSKVLFAIVLSSTCILGIQGAFNVKVTCQACQITNCASKTCYNITSSDGSYSALQCGSCSISRPYQVKIDKCQRDWLSEDCPTNLCFFESPPQDLCKLTKSVIDFCGSTVEKYIVDCRKCENSSCENCLFFNGSAPGSISKSEICYRKDCSSFPSISYDLQQCTNNLDYYGKKCQCCINNQNITLNMGRCTYSSEIFNLYSLTYYGYSKLNLLNITNKNNGGFGIGLGMGVLFVGLLLVY